MRTLPVAPRTVASATMTLALLVVGPLLFGLSRGLAGIATALGFLALERTDSRLAVRGGELAGQP